MSNPLTIEHGDATWQVSRPLSTPVQALLDSACAHFSLNPLHYQLHHRLPRSSKLLDHTSTLRLSSLPPNPKLLLHPSPAPPPNLHLTLDLPTQTSPPLTITLPLTSTLLHTLQTLQPLHPTLHLTSYEGTPPPQTTGPLTLHIHVLGLMQPVIDTAGGRRVTADELGHTTLAGLGLRGRGKLRLSFEYQAPQMTPEQQQTVMGNFARTFTESVEEVDRKVKERADRERREREAAAKVLIPSDRRRHLYRAPVGLLPSPDIPDSFYEVTEADSVEYARSITQQAAAERAGVAVVQLRRPLPHLSIVRVRLPSQLYLEGLFHASELQDAVAEWVKGCLREEVRDRWEVVISPPRKVVKGKRTLREDGLVGSVMMWLREKEEGGVRRGRESALREEKKQEAEEKEEPRDVEEKGEEKVEEKQRQVEVGESKAQEKAPVTGEELLMDEVLSTLVALPTPATAAADVHTERGVAAGAAG